MHTHKSSAIRNCIYAVFHWTKCSLNEQWVLHFIVLRCPSQRLSVTAKVTWLQSSHTHIHTHKSTHMCMHCSCPFIATAYGMGPWLLLMLIAFLYLILVFILGLMELNFYLVSFYTSVLWLFASQNLTRHCTLIYCIKLVILYFSRQKFAPISCYMSSHWILFLLLISNIFFTELFYLQLLLLISFLSEPGSSVVFSISLLTVLYLVFHVL